MPDPIPVPDPDPIPAPDPTPTPDPKPDPTPIDPTLDLTASYQVRITLDPVKKVYIRTLYLAPGSYATEEIPFSQKLVPIVISY